MENKDGSLVGDIDYNRLFGDLSGLTFPEPACSCSNVFQLCSSQRGVDLGTKTVMEKDPNGIDLKAAGAKADLGKSPVFQGALSYFPRAIKAVSEVSLVGAQKYSWKGWETVPDGINRYSDALGRHLLAEAIDGEIDLDTGRLHAEQVAWNSLARLELILKEKENAVSKTGS
jgi:hypothetical protein